ncbi:signal peptidase I [Thermococcus sp. 21S7]|uniref:signal peptidase I n=1 Tax=Thermococcus sp. 21S7 TaxID=1638221 RepID=UPI00143B638F|nr:signal peptidase I [Thermococcus sp. 21S7]NJE62015.1 signal peptidase I [Thermococcus sp. 21S7]
MKRLIELTFTIIILVFLVGSLAGFFLDRPVFLSYAYSESMTPTIDRGDLFLMNPLARNYDVGDIIVFHRRDGWTVHRIFAITEEGYITKGDHNVATDQQDGIYPPVQREDIVGKVITIRGTPLVIRGGGNFIESVRHKMTNTYIIVTLILVGAFLTFSGGGKDRKRKKRRTIRVQMKTIYAAVSVLILAGFLFVTVASWGTLTFTYSSTLAGGQRDGWYMPGSTFVKNLSVENKAVYPFYYFVVPKGDRISLINEDGFKLKGDSSHEVILRVSVPEDTRIYREEVEVYSYPAILPRQVIEPLYRTSPYLPLVPYMVEISAVLLVFYYLSNVGNEDVIRIRTRRRSLLSKVMGDG